MSIVSQATRNSDSAAAEQDKAFFDENGYIGPFTIHEPEVVNAMWKKLRMQLLDKKKAIYGANKMNYDRHLDIKILSDIVSHPDIVRRVQSILGPNILCWRTEWFPKYPGDEATTWHQAESFVAFEGESKLVPTQPHEGSWELTVWFAFTDAKRDTACLKVIPRTHRTWFFDERRNVPYDPSMPMKGMGAGFYGYDFEKLKIDPAWKPDESQAIHFEMQAGQVLMFTSRCLHGSEPNISKDQTRMGFAIRYVPTDVKVYSKHNGQYVHFGEVFPLDRYAAMLVAGEDKFAHNKITRPLAEDG
ncbi:chlorinating enzyme [Sorangium sp. So ce1182]|uniref:chlorinating enzyme n=1 Tax=Sorangium sp. So ce1182 TaxID=3133334 RepID=UPI003F60036B